MLFSTQNISIHDASIINRSVVQSFSRSVVSISLIISLFACRDENRPIDLTEESTNPARTVSKKLTKSNCGQEYRNQIIRYREEVKKLNQKIAQSPNLMSVMHNEVNAFYSDKRYLGYKQGYAVSTKNASSEFDMNLMLEGKRYNLVMKIWNAERMRNRGGGIESEQEYGIALDPGEFYPELEGQPMYLEVEKSDGTQDVLSLPADPSQADSIMANVDYPLILIKPELTEEEWLQMEQERIDALLDWYDSNSVMRTWVCAGIEDENRGLRGGCGGWGGPAIPELPPGGKWLRLVRFTSTNK